MAFQIKSFVSIVAGMWNHVRGTAPGITDFNVGSVARTMLEAPAVEIEEAYRQAFDGLREAIPVATYTSFNFGRLEAAPATGTLHVTVSVSGQDVIIPAGTVFSTAVSSLTYVSQSAVTIAAGGSSGDVVVVASAAGSAGNVAAGSAFTANPLITNFTAATNTLRFNNGRDLESDDQRKQRFTAYVRTLQRGTKEALDFGARTVALFNTAGVEIERVHGVSIVEPYVEDEDQPIAWVKVYVHNGVGSTTTTLRDKVRDTLHGYTDDMGVKVPGWKAAGVKLDVIIATEVTVNVTGTLTAEPGYDGTELATAAEDALSKHFLDLDIGQDSLHKDRIILVSAIPGVANIVFTSTADVAATASEKLIPGTLTITPA